MKASEAKSISKSSSVESPDVQQHLQGIHKRIESRAKLGHYDCPISDLSPAMKGALKSDGYDLDQLGVSWK